METAEWKQIAGWPHKNPVKNDIVVSELQS